MTRLPKTRFSPRRGGAPTVGERRYNVSPLAFALY